MDDGSLSKGFLLKAFAIILGVGVIAFISLVFISSLFVRWGLIGGFIALGLVLLLVGWLFDKRQARQDREAGY